MCTTIQHIATSMYKYTVYHNIIYYMTILCINNTLLYYSTVYSRRTGYQCRIQLTRSKHVKRPPDKNGDIGELGHVAAGPIHGVRRCELGRDPSV